MRYMTRQGERARWLLQWASWCLLFIATLEILSRIDDRVRWAAPLGGTYSHARLVTRDSVTLRGRADYRYQKWAMNDLGFRGKAIAPQAARDVTRIVVLGASESFGLFETEGGEYPAVMQQLFDSIAPGRFEVVNVALPGLSLAAMVPYVEHVVAPLEPDIVVMYPSPSFFLEVSPPAEDFKLPPLAASANAPTQSLARRTIGTFRVLEKTKVVVKRILPTRIQLEMREWRLARARQDHEQDWVWRSVPADRMEIFERHLARVVDGVERTGARTLLVTHMNRFLHREGPLSEADRQHLLALTSSYFPRATEDVAVGVDSVANAIVRRIASARGAVVADAEARLAPDSVNFADYSHFTDEGARAMARLIVEAILSHEAR